MPIFEFSCKNCGTTVERITKSAQTSVPQELILQCSNCKALTRYQKKVSTPAIVVRKAGNLPNAKLRDVRKTRDKHWKQRVIEGKREDGSKLLTAKEMKDYNASQWAAAAEARVPDFKEKKKEIKERSDKGDFKNVTIKDVVARSPKSSF